MMDDRIVLSLLVDNTAGVLSRVVHVQPPWI